MRRIQIWTTIMLLILVGTLSTASRGQESARIDSRTGTRAVVSSSTQMQGRASGRVGENVPEPYYFRNVPQPADLRFVFAPEKKLFGSNSSVINRAEAGAPPSAQAIWTRYLTGQYPPEMLQWYVEQHKQQTTQATQPTQPIAKQPRAPRQPAPNAPSEQMAENRASRMQFSLQARSDDARPAPSPAMTSTPMERNVPSSKAIFAQLFTGRRAESTTGVLPGPEQYKHYKMEQYNRSIPNINNTELLAAREAEYYDRVRNEENRTLAATSAAPTSAAPTSAFAEPATVAVVEPQTQTPPRIQPQPRLQEEQRAAENQVRLVSGTVSRNELEHRDSKETTRVWRPGDSRPAETEANHTEQVTAPDDGWRPVP